MDDEAAEHEEQGHAQADQGRKLSRTAERQPLNPMEWPPATSMAAIPAGRRVHFDTSEQFRTDVIPAFAALRLSPPNRASRDCGDAVPMVDGFHHARDGYHGVACVWSWRLLPEHSGHAVLRCCRSCAARSHHPQPAWRVAAVPTRNPKGNDRRHFRFVLEAHAAKPQGCFGAPHRCN